MHPECQLRRPIRIAADRRPRARRIDHVGVEFRDQVEMDVDAGRRPPPIPRQLLVSRTQRSTSGDALQTRDPDSFLRSWTPRLQCTAALHRARGTLRGMPWRRPTPRPCCSSSACRRSRRAAPPELPAALHLRRAGAGSCCGSLISFSDIRLELTHLDRRRHQDAGVAWQIDRQPHQLEQAIGGRPAAAVATHQRHRCSCRASSPGRGPDPC